jgi:hypothetical protein
MSTGQIMRQIRNVTAAAALATMTGCASYAGGYDANKRRRNVWLFLLAESSAAPATGFMRTFKLRLPRTFFQPRRRYAKSRPPLFVWKRAGGDTARHARGDYG